MPLSQERRTQIIESLKGTARFHGAFVYPKECYEFSKLAEKRTIGLPAVDGYVCTIYIFEANNRVANCPVHINIHGGGWIHPHHINDELFSAWLADAIQGIVVDVDYTLSGTAPWPVAFNQCYEVGKYVYAHCKEWDCNEKRISMGGYSAGGSLTTGVALKAVMTKEFPLCLIVNGYGPLDMRDGVINKNTGDDFLLVKGKLYNELYLDGNDALKGDFYVSPACATDDMLAKMPRTLICSAGECPFRFENEAFGYRLASLGVEVTMRRFLGACHGFIPHFMAHWEEGADLIARSIRDASL
ncbi:MAG: alpha/beta hydrolase fold domain-containing protein [Oscillospiraceae bacterium]